MKIAYFDCFSGISGDMILGALMDLGLPRTELEKELRKLPIGGYEINCFPDKRMGIYGCNVKVILKEQDTHHRSLSDIRHLIEESSLGKGCKNLSIKVFHRLAEAEARIHKKNVEDIRFHEVGAVDSIIDVVGSVIGVRYFGFDRIYASKIPLGSGFVKCRHGILPLPAPATLELLKDKPVYEAGIDGELVTPTGAALITTLGDEFGRMPPMIVKGIGYGVGDNQSEKIPNLLRIVIGEDRGKEETDRVTIVETNIDDMNPEVYDFLMERLFEEGALDVSLTPLQMKKNRPGILLRVICHDEKRPRVVDTILEESTTLGVRFYEAERLKVHRRLEEVDTMFGKVGVKIFQDSDNVMNVSPEYEDCKRIARERKVPLRKIYEEVLTSFIYGKK